MDTPGSLVSALAVLSTAGVRTDDSIANEVLDGILLANGRLGLQITD
jgi:hypothetical protein